MLWHFITYQQCFVHRTTVFTLLFLMLLSAINTHYVPLKSCNDHDTTTHELTTWQSTKSCQGGPITDHISLHRPRLLPIHSSHPEQPLTTRCLQAVSYNCWLLILRFTPQYCGFWGVGAFNNLDLVLWSIHKQSIRVKGQAVAKIEWTNRWTDSTVVKRLYQLTWSTVVQQALQCSPVMSIGQARKR